MKQALIIVLMITSVIVNAQYSSRYPTKNSNWKTPKLYIPSSILVTTFTANQFGNLNQRQRDMVAITGILSSAATYIILKKYKKYRKHRKYKY